MPQGSCLCGAVAFQTTGPVNWMGHCHCSRCRKDNGSAFATFFGVAEDGFTWLRGEEGIERYETSGGTARSFCAACGTVTPSFAGGQVFVAAGAMDDDPGARPSAHIFVGSKAPWHSIPEDGLERFDAYPEGMPAPDLPKQKEPPKCTGDRVRGSCLCGAVRYECGRARGIVDCHCSRCRKARSSAYAANLFAEAAGFRYLEGAAAVRYFKLPEAARFAVGFCAHCGGSLPRDPDGAPFVVVPAGSIDGDPGVREAIHIFVDSKASWLDLHDALPQYGGYPEGCASSHVWIERNTR